MTAFRNSVTLLALLLVAVILTESATAQPATPITDVKILVGKWMGTWKSPRGNGTYELMVHEDGTWDSIVSNLSPGKYKGTLQVAGGKATAQSETSGITYDVTLSEREGKQTLLLTKSPIVIDLTRAQ
jgi:hypothetical protein